MRVNIILASFVSIVSMAQVSVADTVTVALDFLKNPAKAGVVYSLSAASGESTALLDQKDKKFVSSLVITDKAGSIVFKNSDDVDHNIYANDRKSGVQFDVGLMSPGQEIKKNVALEDNTLVRVGCKIHPKMRAYIAHVNSDSYQIFAFQKGVSSYTTELSDVSSDAKGVAFLLAGYDPLDVNVAKGSTVDVVLTRKGVAKANAKVSRF